MRRLLTGVFVSAAALAALVAAMSACVGYLDADAGAPAPANGGDAGGADGGNVAGDGSAGDGGCALGAYACEVLADTPLLYLRFAEGPTETKAHDATGHGYDGTYPSVGVTLGAPGPLANDPADRAVSFSGAGPQEIAMPACADFSGSSFTVEAWIKPEPMDALVFIVDHERFDTRGGWDLDWDQEHVQLELFANDATFLVTSSADHAASTGAWHHVVAAYDAEKGQGVMWVDTVSTTSQRYRDDVVPQVGPWFIGKQNCTPCGTSEFKGSLDELAIYDHVLNDARVKAHFAAAH